jgi:alpha-D-xyloside xylohydrolase
MRAVKRSLTRLQVRDERLVGGLDDGTPVTIELSIPLQGAVRLRCRAGAGAEIVPNDGLSAPKRSAEAPPEVTDTDDGVRITGPGVQMFWRHDGSWLRFGAYERSEEPSAATVPDISGYEAAADGGPGRWTEVIKLGPDSAVYGGGESYQGPNLRGRLRRLRNTEVNRAASCNTAYLNVPRLWSDAGWGLLVNTGAPVAADVAATRSEALSIEILGDELDLILFSGDAPTILRRYAQLTGLPRRLPDWTVDVMHTDEWLQDGARRLGVVGRRRSTAVPARLDRRTMGKERPRQRVGQPLSGERLAACRVGVRQGIRDF